MLFATKEVLREHWVAVRFPNLVKLSKTPLPKQRRGFGRIVRDKFLRLKPHNPKNWVSGKELRKEARSFIA